MLAHASVAAGTRAVAQLLSAPPMAARAVRRRAHFWRTQAACMIAQSDAHQIVTSGTEAVALPHWRTWCRMHRAAADAAAAAATQAGRTSQKTAITESKQAKLHQRTKEWAVPQDRLPGVWTEPEPSPNRSTLIEASCVTLPGPRLLIHTQRLLQSQGLRRGTPRGRVACSLAPSP